MPSQLHNCRGGVGRWLACALALCLAACGGLAPAATLTPTPSNTPRVIATRLLAQLTGQLVLDGHCLRVLDSNVPGESRLLVFPPGFTASVTRDSVLVADFQDRQEFTWRLGDIVQLGGGDLPELDPSLRSLVLADCPGPYWLVGSLAASATATPTLAPAGATAPAVATLTPYFNSVQAAQDVLTRAGPGTIYPVVGQLSAGQSRPVVGQAGQWWELAPENGHTAWLLMDLVSFSGNAQTVPVVLPPPTPTP